MKIESLFEFMALAHSLNFTAAAADLHISQPNLSKHISDMEQELGVKLFHRGKQLRLTTAGEAFLEDSVQIHHMWKAALKKCREISQQEIEELVIQEPFIIDALGQILLKSVARFKHETPMVQTKYYSEKSKKSVKLLEEGRIDIALTIDCNNFDWISQVSDKKNIIFHPIVQEPIYVWASKDHPLAQKQSVKLDDLLDVPINMTATRNFDPMRFAILDLFVYGVGKKPNLQTYSCDTLNEFFMNTRDKEAVFLVSPSVASLPLLNMQKNMTTIPIDDERARITSYLVIRADYEKRSIDDFLNMVDLVVKEDVERDEHSLYTAEIVSPAIPRR